MNGLYSFFPNELDFYPVNNAVDPPFINQISIRNKDESKNRFYYSKLNEELKLKLKPNDYSLKVHFSPSNTASNVYYSYRFTIFGEQWNAYSTNPYVENYAIPAGRYSLDLQASLDPKFPSEEFVRISIYKPKIWYQRLWVQALFLLSALGIGYAFIRYRFNQKLKRQQEMEQLRTKISSDLHDEVGSTLTGLAMQSEMMTYELDGAHKEALHEMADMSRDAMEKMRDTVWAIDSRKDTYKSLIARMHNFAERNLVRKKIEYQFDLNDIDKEGFISPERRQHIYLIFKEAITNVIKHSNATKVVVALSQSEKEINLSIKDNGTDPVTLNPEETDGLGTSNMLMRGKEIGGTLVMKYESGFLVDLNVPLE
ncbi:MAG: histidine kinase [Bacteroidota bacterium]